MTSQPPLAWSDFLEQLCVGVDRFAARVNNAPPNDQPVRYEANAQQAKAGEVFIGVGNDCAPGATCLNYKDEASFRSQTDYVLAADDAQLAAWNPPADDPVAGVLGERVLVVKDASPDSCFALVCLLARWSGVAVEAIPRNWIEHIDLWKLGDVITTGAPRSSFGALHNALVHSFLIEAWGQAWVAGLRFLLSALQSGDPPDQLGAKGLWLGLEQARAHLDFEHQTYLDGLDFATQIQLRMPMRPAAVIVAGADDRGDQEGGTVVQRWLLVDAYLAREALPQGTLKSFLRTDREHTWFKNGFTLMALYRPTDIGGGNDLTVSVTPGLGVDLRDLWRYLEEREYEGWGGWEQRPHDRPRTGIAGYPEEKTADGHPSPNQPWYDEQGRYTILGAPRSAEPGKAGSRLDWEAFQEAIWRIYHPFKGLRVRAHQRRGGVEDTRGDAGGDAGGAGITLEQAGALVEHPASPRPVERCLKVVHWDAESGADQNNLLRFTPTLKRYLAACVVKRDGPVALADLPDEDSFEFLQLAGGFAVISAAGAYVIDDWHRELLKVDEIKAEFESACQRLDEVITTTAKVAELQDGIERFLKGERAAPRPADLVKCITGVRQRLGKVSMETLPQSLDPGVLRLREALDRRWGLPGRIEALTTAIDQAGALLHSHLENRTSGQISLLTLYGFPVALTAGFFSFSFSKLPTSGPVAEFVDSIHWPALALFILISVLLMGLLFVVNRWIQHRTRLSGCEITRSRNTDAKNSGACGSESASEQ